jgi:hypothetical protein
MQQSIYILHEGKPNNDDNKVFKSLVDNLKKEFPHITPDKIDYHAMGTKSNFFKKEKYPPLLIQGVETDIITKVFFIVDADYEHPNKNNPEERNPTGGYENTQNALNKIIAELGFQQVCSTYIMCDPVTKTGYLESFILSTIPEHQKNCIERFLECSQFKSKENHKAILKHIYNMAYPKKEGEEEYYFEHSHFEELKTKLINLFK